MNGKLGEIASQSSVRRWHAYRAVLFLLPLIALAFVAVRVATSRLTSAPSAGETTEGEPAKVGPAGEGGLHSVVLSARAAERLGVQTATVGTADVAGAQTGALRAAVPFAAILYDVHGGTWVYTSPQPLTFIRQRVTVEQVDGDRAVVSGGPPVGTQVVTVGVAELFGTEFGGLVEQ